MAVTYATARAACVARWGEPTYVDACDDAVTRWWNRRDDQRVLLTCAPDGLWLTLADDAEERAFTLAGEPSPDAPAATLPAALDAADAFLRTTATATKGP